jgi:UPF0755 protein
VFGKGSDDTRTSQDRARAAAERAARRSGRPLPPEAFEQAVPPPDMVEHERHTAEYTPFETGEHALPGEQPPDTGEHPAEAPGGSGSLTAVSELPVQPPPPARRRTLSPAGPRRGRGGHWPRRIGALIGLLVIVGALYFIDGVFQPFHGDGKGAVAVTIPAGANAAKIGDLLAARGVVDSGRFFALNAMLTGRRGKLHPGQYTLARGMTNSAAISALTKGPAVKPIASFKLTIPEGPSRREMAPKIEKSGVKGSYLKASETPEVLKRVHALGAPAGTKTAEGFLFPATYTLPDGSTAGKLVGEQLDAFDETFGKLDMSYAKKKKLTRYDVLIIASMIEREAQVAKDRPLVSAVIYNRLKRGMPLAIDATIRYYTNNWQRPIRQSELDAREPFNTRIHEGLPPTPIGNPGLASLQAAAHPADKPYLFYVRKPGNSGEHAFSSTDAQFERDVQRYEAARKGK